MIQTNKSATLSTNNDQYLFVPVYSVENHPTDSRVKIDPNGTVQTLTSRMGTGGGNVPLIMEQKNITLSDVASTPRAGAGTPKHEQDYVGRLVIERSICMIDSIAGQAERGWKGEVAPALKATHYKNPPCVVQTAMDRHAVAYSQQAYDEYVETDKGCTLKSSGGNYGGGSENIVVEPQYIVRRLCPTECARLQGFQDKWGHPDHKDDFTDEEYAFWLKVRNDWATINGKTTKEYTKEQMLKWYNSLHTDSAEYEMWGNGICLQNALYVMEGIAEVLRRRKERGR